MADEREVVVCTKSILLAVSFSHSAAATDIKHSFAAKYERMIDMKNQNGKILAYGAILIALNIVLTRLLSINIGPVRIGFNFLPIALGSILFGPWLGAVFALVADVLGQLLTGGMPWLGFCINTALYGISYGLFFYKRGVTLYRLIVCAVLQAVIVDAILGSLWFYHYMGTPFMSALLMRGVDALCMVPVKVIVLKYVCKYLGEKLKV